MERINDYITDKEIYNYVEYEGLTYGEVSARIENLTGVEFSESAIGQHYRDYKAENVVDMEEPPIKEDYRPSLEDRREYENMSDENRSEEVSDGVLEKIGDFILNLFN